ncbi:GNAT family N-acetyltransferase [Aliikangiella marina]|uniref:GNAT family N-acetyltransferase n=1 Tax=Aliikangiella marina TaxID=1712262 RepID=A0A545TI36_9GAMM|nr:GNAT family protein [Aliikangiella marina]TQV76875.1 GNAT family N-acetyltransferase [Aliikangiella marina]
MQLEIETKNLLIKKIQSDDFELYRKLYSSPQVMKYISPVPPDEVIKKTFTKCLEPWSVNTKSSLVLTIFVKTCNSKVGILGVTTTDLKKMVAEPGIMLLPEHQSMGVAFEAFKECLKYCFDSIGYKKVQGSPHRENVASIKMIRKLGYQFYKTETLQIFDNCPPLTVDRHYLTKENFASFTK